MLIVAQQHGVDFADPVGAKRGAGKFFQFHMRQLIGAGPVEGRIGQKPEAVDLDQRGRAADQRDG